MEKFLIDVELVFDRFLDDSVYDSLAKIVSAFAPKWAANPNIYEDRKHIPVDFQSASHFRNSVVAVATTRGSAYRAMVKEQGVGDERVFGSVELRGGSRELVLVISIDEKPLTKIGKRLLLGNCVALQIRANKIEGHDAKAWAMRIFKALCSETSPAWGTLRDPAEYRVKVMSASPSIEAVGRDFGRYLPGLFSWNYLGDIYADFIGRNRIINAPALSIEEVKGGIFIGLSENPQAWDTQAYSALESAVRKYIGPEFFFEKNIQNDSSRSPFVDRRDF